MRSLLTRLSHPGSALRFSTKPYRSATNNLHPIGYRSRKFHRSRELRSSLLDSCCIQAHDALIGLHATTGLPWYLTLPLVAVLVRSTIFVPFAIWSRVNLQRATSVRPLIFAWERILVNRVMKEHSHLGPDACKKLADANKKDKRLELYQTFGIRRWLAFTPLLQLPVFLLTIETVRRMCDGRGGLLSFIAEKLGDSSEDTASVPLETTLATEGGLWFPDLLVPDPQFILPATLSVLLYVNVSDYGNFVKRSNVTPSRLQVGLSRSFKIVALAMFPLTLKLPAGMLIYWVSSAAYALLTKALLSLTMPLPSVPDPCKPPVPPYKKDLTGKISAS